MSNLQTESAANSTVNNVASQSLNTLFQEYVPDNENVLSYLDRFECFMSVNDVSNEKKAKLFIASVGATVYQRLVLLAIPKRPMELSYAEIETLMKAEYGRKPLVHVARYNFRQRHQKVGESFQEFYNSLRELAKDCGFETADKLKDELKGQIIAGIRDPRTQSHYFGHTLSLEEVVRKAEIDEQVANGVKHFRPEKASIDESLPESVSRINDAVRRKKFPSRNVQSNANNSRPPSENSSAITTTSNSEQVPVCYRCARQGHKADICFFRSAVCNRCQKVGHIAAACSKPRDTLRSVASQKVNSIEVQEEEEPYEIVPISAVTNENPDNFDIEQVSTVNLLDPKNRIFTNLNIEGKNVIFEADSGSRYAIMSKANFLKLNICKRIEPCKIILRSYTGNFIFVLGVVKVDVTYNNVTSKGLQLLIVDENFDTIFGREWWYALKFNIFHQSEAKVYAIDVPFDLKHALKNVAIDFFCVFEECVGTLKKVVEHVYVDKNFKPIFCRHRNVVFALRDNVTNEIDRLVNIGIYEPVAASDWATPLVIVQKAEGAVRLVGDYSVTVNKAVIPEEYPIPNIEELLYDFRACRYYSKFDVREAYMQMPVDAETAAVLTVNTHKGLFKVNRLNYGVQSAPAKWQRYVENIFKPVQGCKCFYDDIKISSENAHAHLGNVKMFLSICKDNGIKLKRSKCQLLTNELNYLGFRINEKGVHKTSEKVDAVIKAPAPRNVSEVKSFTGLVVFYSRFLPNVSEILHPLNNLLRKEVPFVWDGKCQAAFNLVKKEIASPRVLCHFDPSKKLILATDASPFAVGAVLSHQFENGERPIAFVSRSLNKSEVNYSQIDKESLAIYWGVKKFFDYLFGRPFILYVDCKPLQSIFNSNAAKPALSATRLLHYAVFLQGFQYEIRYRRSEQHSNADFVSRFPIEKPTDDRPDEPSVVNLQQIVALPLSLPELAAESARDPEIALVLKKLRNTETSDTTTLSEYTVEKGCLLYGTRVFIPKKFRKGILQELHTGHLGMTKMKGLARSHVFWPGLDAEIEQLVRACEPCQVNAKAVSVPPHPWQPPSQPWERLHIDYAGPFLSFSFLIIVDALTKWPEVFPVPASRVHGTNSLATIEKLVECFARFGYPQTLVSDNGVQFTSNEFKEFCRRNYICQMHSAPYYPQSNGRAERFVQTVKRALRIAILEKPGESIHRKLHTFLLAYRRAPTSDGSSPYQKLFGRPLRSRIDILRSVETFSSDIKPHTADGTPVWYRTFSGSRNWDRGVLERRIGQVMVEVRGTDGQLHRRHLAQVRTDHSLRQNEIDTYPISTEAVPRAVARAEPPNISVAAPTEREPVAEPIAEEAPAAPLAAPPPAPAVAPVAVEPRRSNRTRREPDRFSP